MSTYFTGSLFTLLDAIAVSQSTEVPYQTGRQRNSTMPIIITNFKILLSALRDVILIVLQDRKALLRFFVSHERRIRALGKGKEPQRKAKLTAIADVCNG